MMRSALILTLLLSACDARAPIPVPPAALPSGSPSAAGHGTVRGVVRVKGGDIAPIRKIGVGAEAHCGSDPLDLGVWRVEPESRGLQDAYLYVEGPAGDFPPAPMAALDNRRCLFQPPVILMAPGHLKLVNSGTPPHNTH